VSCICTERFYRCIYIVEQQCVRLAQYLVYTCIYLHVYLLIYAYTWMYICIFTRHVCRVCLVWVYKHTCIELDWCQTGQYMVCTCVYLLIYRHVSSYIWRYICICTQLASDVCITTHYRFFFWNAQDRFLTLNTYIIYICICMYAHI